MPFNHGNESLRCYAFAMGTTVTRIIGIDPGLRRTGWGVVDSDGVRLIYVASGLITSQADAELAYRLRELFEGIASVIASFKPQEAAVEETFVNDNARSTLKLGQARGMALLAPAMGGLLVAEYPPNLIKKSVTGAGHAEKRQIEAMIGYLLPKARVQERRRSGRACHRHLPCQSSPSEGEAGSRQQAVGSRLFHHCLLPATARGKQ